MCVLVELSHPVFEVSWRLPSALCSALCPSAQGTWHPVLSVPTGPWPANGGIGGGWESSSVIRLRVA